jgi:hypothetical protein
MKDRPDGESALLLARLAETLASLDDDRPQAWRLCEAIRRITGAAGVVVTIGYLWDVRTTLCATDDIAAAIDGLQELVGEGPGFDAAADGEMVTCYLGDVQQSRWSHLARAMWDELRAVTVYAIPIQAGGGLTGVVTLYTQRRRALHVSGENAAVLARAIGVALLAEAQELQDNPTDPRGPWTSRIVVHQATGMVMAQLGIPADDALSLLRSHAYADEADLAAVARQVVQRKLTFSRAASDRD